ncbi:DUF3106 domain-containing protein [Algisphaera agarilytica]|uniref:Uncharacterized protein n=1 Tax=Algisphaera agarilytica TaxID=1385975 RepID=A0A7X0H2Z2_9BACT|nr:DUF3106 domain-containing protein [Algisphaera agarilytica]MBB6428322.1 hypothetical protein [Algisphaera agarilytica]
MPGKLSVQEVDVKAERRKALLRRGSLVIGGAVVVAVVGGASWYLTPPAMPETIEEAQALVQSPRFDRLSKEAKQPYYDVIREQYGSLDPETRKQLRAEDEKLAEAMRDARMIQFRSMLVGLADMPPEEREELASRFRGNRPGGDRPEPSAEEQAERADRLRDHISDRMANGDSQMNQLMREMFSQKYKKQK